jgi:triphosphatase
MGKKKKAELLEIFNASIDAIEKPLNRVIALDDDIEAVHQYRVKIRQLRSLIAFFKPKLEDKLAEKVNCRLKEMASVFSKVREMDVLTQRWQSIADDQRPEHHDFGTNLIRAKQQARIEAYTNFRPTQTNAYLIWIKEQMNELFSSDKKLSDFIEKRLNQWLCAIRKDVKKLSIDDYPSMHELRIRIKRLRYALTLLSDHVNEDMVEKIKPSKLWAEQLGVICDFQRNRDILNELFVRDVECKILFIKSMKSEVDEIREQLRNTRL